MEWILLVSGMRERVSMSWFAVIVDMSVASVNRIHVCLSWLVKNRIVIYRVSNNEGNLSKTWIYTVVGIRWIKRYHIMEWWYPYFYLWGDKNLDLSMLFPWTVLSLVIYCCGIYPERSMAGEVMFWWCLLAMEREKDITTY